MHIDNVSNFLSTHKLQTFKKKLKCVKEVVLFLNYFKLLILFFYEVTLKKKCLFLCLTCSISNKRQNIDSCRHRIWLQIYFRIIFFRNKRVKINYNRMLFQNTV